jgi:hypothetical protein
MLQLLNLDRQTKQVIFLAFAAVVVFGCASTTGTDIRDTATKHITDIAIIKNSESLTVSIESDQSLTYTAHKQVAPLGVVFQFPDTLLDIAHRAYLLPDNEIIRSLNADTIIEDNKSTARIFITLKKDAPYDLSPDVSGLNVVFPAKTAVEKQTRPQKVSAEKKPEPEIPQKSTPLATIMKSVSAKPLKDNIAIVVKADGAIKDYKSFSMHQPPRIVFDIYDLKSTYKGVQKMAVKSKWVQRIRHFGHPDKVRLVLETREAYLSKYSARSIDSGLIIHVGEISTEAAKTGQFNLNAPSGSKQVTLAWDPVPDATSYNVYWSGSPGVTRHNGNKISNIKDPATTIKGLQPGMTYYFVVTTVKGVEESQESAELSFTVGE